MLHYETVSPNLLAVLKALMNDNALNAFRLVGGTALSLQLGHRISVDIDLFTDKFFQTTDLELFIKEKYPNSILQSRTSNGLCFEIDSIKVDCYNWNVPFIENVIGLDNIRLASLADICAFKLDAITSRKEIKDYWDIATLLSKHTFSEMEVFYKKKYPYNNFKMVLEAMSEHDKVTYLPLKSLNTSLWNDCKSLLDKTVQGYFEEQKRIKIQAIQSKEDTIRRLIEKKKK